jgi:hypothetical protein
MKFGTSSTAQLPKKSVSSARSLVEKLQRQGLSKPNELRVRFLEESRPKDSPTHHLFEWDDSAAAEAYRLEQAGSIIRSITVTFEESPDEPVRAFPIVSVGGKRSYQTMAKVMSDAEMTQSMLAQAKADLEMWSERYSRLRKVASALSPVFDVIDKVKKKK